MDKDVERVTVAVTPPGADTPRVRAWMEAEARKSATDLRWTEETDRHGNPMGRLTGVRR